MTSVKHVCGCDVDVYTIYLIICSCSSNSSIYFRAEKERLKAEKAAKKAAQAAAEEAANRIPDVTYLSSDDQDSYEPMGDMSTVMSRARSGRKFADVNDIGTDKRK